MKLRDGGLIVVGVVLVIALGFNLIAKWMDLKEDGVVEELIEEAIEAGTGVDIDLTPFSPEK